MSLFRASTGTYHDSFETVRRLHMSIADELTAYERATDSPRAVLQSAPKLAAALVLNTREKLATIQARPDLGPQSKSQLAALVRRENRDRLAELRHQVTAAREQATSTIARGRGAMPASEAAELARQAAWTRIQRHLDSEHDPARTLAWLQRRIEAAKLAGATAELEAIRREAPDYLEARGDFVDERGQRRVPPALRAEIERAAGSDDSVRALTLGEELQRGAYRVTTALAMAEAEISGQSIAPNMPGWGAGEVIDLGEPTSLTPEEAIVAEATRRGYVGRDA